MPVSKVGSASIQSNPFLRCTLPCIAANIIHMPTITKLGFEIFVAMTYSEPPTSVDIAAVMQINLQKLWVTLGSIMVSLTFVFGNNMRSIYEAVVYLFVVHPYDVGDAVLCGPNQDWCTVSLSRQQDVLQVLDSFTECDLTPYLLEPARNFVRARISRNINLLKCMFQTRDVTTVLPSGSE